MESIHVMEGEKNPIIIEQKFKEQFPKTESSIIRNWAWLNALDNLLLQEKRKRRELEQKMMSIDSRLTSIERAEPEEMEPSSPRGEHRLNLELSLQDIARLFSGGSYTVFLGDPQEEPITLRVTLRKSS